ncbi:MAG: DUF547 domain-containing protein, partial [Elusimicrobiota bacterium]|nr:DUF547 domain-containing protein [Elusimicrobiota bacterium]
MKKNYRVFNIAAAAALLFLSAAPGGAFDQTHALFDKIVKQQLSSGRFDYKSLKASPGPLDAYLKELAAVAPSEYEAWTRADKIAFWINAYNAFTIKAIIDNYPIKSNWKASLRYPKNSIRQIPGVWDSLKFKAIGREITLNDIEHKTLRKEFGDPRAHMALVCASIGCPELRAEVYTGADLNTQLDDQSRQFLKNPAKFRIDKEAGKVYLSPIFKWFSEDFKPDAPAFISRYADEADGVFLKEGKFKVSYL